MTTFNIARCVSRGRTCADLLLPRCRWRLRNTRPLASQVESSPPAEQDNSIPQRLAPPPRGRRLNFRQFDLEPEWKKAELRKEAEEEQDEEDGVQLRISDITDKAVEGLWPPAPLMDFKSKDKLMESLDQSELMEKVDEEERREVARWAAVSSWRQKFIRSVEGICTSVKSDWSYCALPLQQAFPLAAARGAGFRVEPSAASYSPRRSM
ncbi:unnamed protein product [Symbiodinium natans]|uniref:Uncharacterized protein n=1 Tax=Symbiodinium natans TaxID=878477 RepID=A0A812RZ98_9DINO|nr:unnamed protein product [Symbiodinium natans]